MSELDLSPTKLDIKMTRGATYRVRFSLTDANGGAIDLANATMTQTVRKTKAAASTLIFTEDGITESPTSTGRTVVTRTDEEMATIGTDGTIVTYYHEVRLIEADGDEHVA